MTTEMDYDVLVAGAGPVGLTLALELRLAGVRVLVVERRTEPDTAGKAGAQAAVTALARLHADGVAVSWEALFSAVPSPGLDLPTYAFQRERYRLSATSFADAPGLGQDRLDHPLLVAATELPDGTLLLTGRLASREHPWLADHAVHGTSILPGAAFAELMLRAAVEAGLAGVEELTLEVPLVLGEDAGVQLQLSAGPADGDGRRACTVRSRAPAGWTLTSS